MEYQGYKIELESSYNLYKIKNKQGPAPKALWGFFTTTTEACKAVDGYLASRKKGSQNGSTKDSDKG